MVRTVMNAATVLYLILVGLLFVFLLVSGEPSFAPMFFCFIYCIPCVLYATVKVMDLYQFEFPEEKSIWWGHAFFSLSSPGEESPELKFWQHTAARWYALLLVPALLFAVTNFLL